MGRGPRPRGRGRGCLLRRRPRPGHTVDGGVTEAAYDGERIALDALPVGRPVEVVVDARLPYVTSGEGVHRFTDPADGETYVSAYCGMDIAYRVFACFDQNDLKATISLTVSADPRWTVLANGIGSRDESGRWSFTPTPAVPVALFVVCARPWASLRWVHRYADGRELPCGWHARRSAAGDLARDAAELRATTDAVLEHYAGLFDELDDAQLDLLRSVLAGDVPTVLRRQWDDELDDRTRAAGSGRVLDAAL